MNLPGGAIALTTIEEIKAAWGKTFIQEIEGELFSPLGRIEEGEDGKPTIRLHPWVTIAPDAVYVEVTRPIRCGKDLVETTLVRIDEPNHSNMKAGDRVIGEMAKAGAILSSICNIPSADMDRITVRDFNRLGQVIGAFLAESEA